MLRLNEELAVRIRAHAAETYPHECCGALLGSDGESHREVLDLLPLENRNGDSPRNRFAITSDDVRRAEKVARDLGFELIGWYHSHPDHPALPSEFDRVHAWPWYSYLIVSVEQRRPGQIASWRLAEDRSRFAPERIEIAARVVVAHVPFRSPLRDRN
ncbi:MAG: M67 family metallopeptidase [Acidobacteria bacterium]|nr:M67 family metallopeptidase [Acidobacteriota bacterium]MBI3661851.1 M67 family metallopeptidase [Acidobacteriota bacterium]